MKNMTSLQRRLRAQEINLMNEDDKSMHIFYTLEEIEQLVASLHKKMDTNDRFLGQKIAALEDVISTLEGIHSRCETAQKYQATELVNA